MNVTWEHAYIKMVPQNVIALKVFMGITAKSQKVYPIKITFDKDKLQISIL